MRASQVYAPPMAMVTTLGLLFLMYSLISTDFELPVTEDPPKVESVVMPEPVLETRYLKQPDKPAPPEDMPPPVADPVPKTQVADVTNIRVDLPVVQSKGTDLTVYSGGDYMPIVKVAPQYPRIALNRGIEGFVTVSFTVTETGATRNVAVLEAVTKDGTATSIFDRAAIAAAEQFKYQPRVQDGVAVEVHGVKNRFVFELE